MATRGPKPGTENARHGGQAVAAKYGGSAYYRRIGRLGGIVTQGRQGTAWYAEIGQKGGETTRDRHPGHYAAIGAKGGKSHHPARDRSDDATR